MADSDDFTFCEVGKALEDEFQSPKIILNTESIYAERDDLDGRTSSKISAQDDLAENVSSEKIIAEAPLKEPERGMSESAVETEDPITAARQPIKRSKVPFEKGYSQMDWLKLTRTHPDLAGLKGQTNRRLISLDEVKQHKKEGPIWTVLKGRVYNISPYMKFHPGGVDMLMKAAGRDCTALFNKYHAWVNAEFLLEKCLVGFLDESQ
ncbi:unnamed protein product [Spirodela intermedia]|uniref:Cytochrome b5 heme-binding domain-containing protein n=1 Tax=Spirodela intermedia TaxID=51605 RepID=A0A7I8KQF2_SPIIN|nr:unnamed protein product [Spirodela intermedia]